MAFTRSQITEMKEGELQKQVLIPLFRAMRFRDVQLYHGGSLEQGKDIVMWKPDELRERLNYGVVVKAGKISGQASGKSSAAEVRFQIEQCFNTSFADTISTEERRIHRCYVVTSGEISKEATNAIKDTLRTAGHDRVTDFIDGNKLWELVQKYMPEQTVWDDLQQAQRKLDELSPEHYRLEARSTGQIDITGRYPGVEKDHPLKIWGTFTFPDTPEGQQKREELERMLATGSQVTIPTEYIESLELPDFLQSLIDPSGENVGTLTIGPRRSERPRLVKVEVESNDGERVVLDYIHLEAVQMGVEEVTLVNDRQPMPVKLRLVINFKTRKVHTEFTLQYKGTTIKQMLDGLRFERVFSKGGRLRIENLETGIELANESLPANTMEAPKLGWVKLLEKLVYIQSKTHVPLTLPERAITRDELRRIFATARTIEIGSDTFHFEEFKGMASLELARNLVSTFDSDEEQYISISFSDEQTVKIFDTDVTLGPVNLTCERVFMEEKDLNDLKAALTKSLTSVESVPFRLVPYENCPVEARYLKWLSEGSENVGVAAGSE